MHQQASVPTLAPDQHELLLSLDQQLSAAAAAQVNTLATLATIKQQASQVLSAVGMPNQNFQGVAREPMQSLESSVGPPPLMAVIGDAERMAGQSMETVAPVTASQSDSSPMATLPTPPLTSTASKSGGRGKNEKEKMRNGRTKSARVSWRNIRSER